MHPKRAYWHMLLPIMILGLTGCAGFELRKGPDPVLDGTAAYNASGNKELLLGALARDAGFNSETPASADFYYMVAEAGFNYVDDQCRAYFDHLFFLNKGREQLKSGLAATNQTTLAILGITGAAVPTMTIVAQAFGLASAATDIVSGTYLYALPPATTQGFVERLQLAFRAQASRNSGFVRSPAAAYYLIQRYLNLCLPPTIEAEITKQISNTGVVGQPVGNGEFFTLTTFSTTPQSPVLSGPISSGKGSSRSPIDQRRRASSSAIFNPREPLPETQKQPPSMGGLHLFEQSLKFPKKKQIQKALCVSPSGEFDLDPDTRKAFRFYLEGRRAPKVEDQITAGNIRFFLEATQLETNQCLGLGPEFARKVGEFVKAHPN